MASVVKPKKFCPRDLAGDFKIIRWVGSGAFGVVYEAKWFERRIAVKFLHEKVLLNALSVTLGKFRNPRVLAGFLEMIKSDRKQQFEMLRSTTDEIDDLAIAYADSVPDDEKLLEITGKLDRVKRNLVDTVLREGSKLFSLDAGGVQALVDESFDGASDGLLGLQNVYADLMNEATIIRELPPHPNVVSFVGVIQTERPVMRKPPKSERAEREDYEMNAAFFTRFAPNSTPEPVIMTEFVDGITLDDLLAKFPGKFTNQKFVTKIMHDVARGMNHIHKKKVIHGDLAARNIMIELGEELRGTSAKITDFGMSVKMWSECDVLEGPQRGRGDGRGVQGNIANILPPEYYLSLLRRFKELGSWGYDLPSDVWQYGLLFYEIAKDVVPFHQHVTPGERRDFWIRIQQAGLDALDAWEKSHAKGVKFEGQVPFPFTLAFDEPTDLSLVAEICLNPNPIARPTFSDIMGYFLNPMILKTAAGSVRPMPGTIVTYGDEKIEEDEDDGWVVRSDDTRQSSGSSSTSW